MRVHGTTRRRPIDLFDGTERAALRPLPCDAYEVTRFSRHKVRKDCHVHVLSNYYSVPHAFVGMTVTVRVCEQRVDVHANGECVASHERARGRGESCTQSEHYPPTKRLATQEIHRRRVEHVRTAGPHTIEYLGRLREGPWVFADQVARLARLATTFGHPALERACARALHFGALDGAARVESILTRGLHNLPLEPLNAATSGPRNDFGRSLVEYDALLCAEKVAS